MKQAFIEINKVPTKVLTWGRWIEDPANPNEEIVLCIPGNPGLTGYYYRFLEAIHDKLNIPVWIVGHGGHEEPENDSSQKVLLLKGNEHLYDTEGQIRHKMEFIKKYIPKDAKVHLIGHSVGCYIILQLLKDEGIKSKIVSSSMLFPTIMHLAETPNGRFVTYCVKPILAAILFVSWVFCLFPRAIGSLLVYIYFFITSVPKYNIPTTLELIKPSVLERVFYMGFDEIDIVQQMDVDVIKFNKDKLKFYYGATDNWAPVHHCKTLMSQFPNIDAQVCERNFTHAFVLRSSKDVGEMVAGWITDCQTNYNI